MPPALLHGLAGITYPKCPVLYFTHWEGLKVNPESRMIVHIPESYLKCWELTKWTWGGRRLRGGRRQCQVGLMVLKAGISTPSFGFVASTAEAARAHGCGLIVPILLRLEHGGTPAPPHCLFPIPSGPRKSMCQSVSDPSPTVNLRLSSPRSKYPVIQSVVWLHPFDLWRGAMSTTFW